MHNTVIDLRDITYSWPGERTPTLALDHFSVQAREHVFVSGPSGSGKSTLLALIGGIVTAHSGSVNILGKPLQNLSATKRDRFRVDHIGFIFQQFNLIPYLSILDNVLLPCHFSAYRRQRVLAQEPDLRNGAESLLRSLDLAPSLWARTSRRLSIGQQQRVAAARALIGRPEIIIADEPTSALDSDRQQAFLDLVQHECAQASSCLVFVSHDLRLGERFHRRIDLDQINSYARKEEQV